MCRSLWTNDDEIAFFNTYLRNTPPSNLFYRLESGYYAYIPKHLSGEGQTLQSRNTSIGKFTEEWVQRLFSPFANQNELFAVNNVVCEEIALTSRSPADVALCTTSEKIQSPENIKIIFEIKMSVVSNYRYVENTIEYIGDYKSHKGNPSLLRSDSMLKAIGKAINIRVSGSSAEKIPIIILGNSPITDSYMTKVDYLKNAGVIQGFWSLNPCPTNGQYNHSSDRGGFITMESMDQLSMLIENTLRRDEIYFSSMLNKSILGQFIVEANEEDEDREKAEKFLNLLRNFDG